MSLRHFVEVFMPPNFNFDLNHAFGLIPLMQRTSAANYEMIE